MSDYKNYKLGTKVRIRSTGENGEAFESALGYVSVFIDGEDKCRYFKEHDVHFIKKCNKPEDYNCVKLWGGCCSNMACEYWY